MLFLGTTTSSAITTTNIPTQTPANVTTKSTPSGNIVIILHTTNIGNLIRGTKNSRVLNLIYFTSDDSTWLLKNEDDVMCLTFGRAAGNGMPIELKSEDCTLKKSVVCKHEKIQIAPTVKIPPRFPCISTSSSTRSKRSIRNKNKKNKKNTTTEMTSIAPTRTASNARKTTISMNATGTMIKTTTMTSTRRTAFTYEEEPETTANSIDEGTFVAKNAE